MTDHFALFWGAWLGGFRKYSNVFADNIVGRMVETHCLDSRQSGIIGEITGIPHQVVPARHIIRDVIKGGLVR